MSRVVAEARKWIGTPYRHQASRIGYGADCLGLLRGIWRETVGPEPQDMEPYSPDWAETSGGERLRDAARRWLIEIAVEDVRQGDVLLFRMARDAPMKHCAIVSRTGPPEMKIIHAYWGRAVVETWLGPWWQSRIAAAFRFPPTMQEN